MNKLIIALLALAPLCAAAQATADTVLTVLPDTALAQPRITIAVYSYDKCWAALPEVAQVKAEIEALKAQYVEELKRAEADFNSKYEDFLEQQAKLAPSIRNKRQAERQKILEENLAFKARSQETLANTEKVRMKPLQDKLKETVAKVAKEYNYTIVINTDGNNCPFFDPALIIDITDTVIENY